MFQNKTSSFESENATYESFNLTAIDYAYFFASVIIFVPTVVGNSLILIALYRFKELRSPMGLLIGNLAVSDFLVGLILIPVEVSTTVLNLTVFKYVCLFSIGVSVLLTSSSVLSMLTISIERFIAVAKPLKHRSPKMRTITKMSIPVMWSSVLIIGFLPILGLNQLDHRDRCMYKEVFLDSYTIFITSFLTGCTIINVIFFVLVVRVALSQLRKVHNSSADYNHARISRNLAKTYAMMIVSALFIVCWGPFSVLTVMGLFHQWGSYPVVLRWAYFAGFLNSGINWMIYGFRNPKFRKAIKAVLTFKATMSDAYITNSSRSVYRKNNILL